MVTRAPRIAAVLPSLLEFVGDAVIVGHNVRFDLSFLNAALTRHDRPTLANPSVDTCSLARRLLRDDVPNCKLDTLATRLRLDHRPSHRALDDALATTDLLHVLIERASGLGVTGLDDLLALPTLAGTAHVAKLKLTDRLPRAPGIYVFRDVRGEVLYVGKASNLRSRVRSYFSTDSRRKVGNLLRELARIDHTVCRGALEATVLELRLIQQHAPRYNRVGRRRAAPVFVRLTDERFPRLSTVRKPPPSDVAALGPLTTAHARARHRSDRDRRSVAPLFRSPRTQPARVPLPGRAARCGVVPLRGRNRCRHLRHPCRAGASRPPPRPVAVARAARGAYARPRRGRAFRRSGGDARSGRRVGVGVVAAAAGQRVTAGAAHGLRHSRRRPRRAATGLSRDRRTRRRSPRSTSSTATTARPPSASTSNIASPDGSTATRRV